MIRCHYCGESYSKSVIKSEHICPSCYAYLRRGGVFHPLPEYGKIERDEHDRPICHICGQAYTKLGCHIAFKHHMLVKDYKKEFGLHNNTNLTSLVYKQKMRRYIEENKDIVITENLLHKGLATRFKHK